MILAVKTDNPVAELYILNHDGTVQSEYRWQAGRQLAASLLATINDFLKRNSLGLGGLTGIVVYSGGGSFTGLRIGTSVANALAYSLNIPVAKSTGEDWLNDAAKLVSQSKLGSYVRPDYSGAPNIT